MHDDAPTAEVARFLREAASAFPAEPPTPGPGLAVLFAEGLPAPALTARPLPTRRSTMRSAVSSLPRKLALAAAGLTFAGTGLAAASALPGVDDVTEALPEVSTTLPDVDTTVPDVDTTLPDVSTTVPDVSTTVPDISTTVPDVTTPTTTPTGGTGALPLAPTTASQAAHIHAFDEACGNHGRYVSFVARNGTEPSCATDVRNGTTTPSVPTDDTDDEAAPDEPAAGAAKAGGRPATAGPQAGGAAGRANAGR